MQNIPLEPHAFPNHSLTSSRTKATKQDTLTIELRRCKLNKFREIDPKYLSLSIDISVLAGGNWWEGSNAVHKGLGANKVEALNLNNPELDRLVAPLAPFYIRLGGSESDTVDYFLPVAQKKKNLLLSQEHWDGLHTFVKRNKLKLYFTAKYGVFDRKQHGHWDGTELESLLQYSKQQGYELNIAELGNELNAYWIFHGITAQPGPKNLAKDYRRFSQLMKSYYSEVRISGPGSAFWPKLGEPIAPFSNITRSFLENISDDLDIIDWHYYPFQSKRSPVRTRTARYSSMLNPRSFEDFAKYCGLLKSWRKRYHPEAELWTGESGSAQCGGQAGISDRWASSFWWADQLGLGAKLGQSVMIRQSLIGGDYGLIDRCTLQPRPDYWLSVFWVKLMGTRVHPVHCKDKYLRTYCHENTKGERTLLLINLTEESRAVNCEEFGKPFEQFEFTAPSLDSKTLFINGLDASTLIDSLDINRVPSKKLSHELAGRSINFWRLQ
ncbi:MAG: glycoside hydrolase [Agarilytica sp.]